MKQIVLAALIGVVWMMPAQSDKTGDANVEATITRQIDAFRAQDFAEAFGLASERIRKMFGTPERFGRMVERGYPMVLSPREVNFLDLNAAHGTLWQKVEMRDGAGIYHVLAYQMVRAQGAWRIGAVHYLGKGVGIAA